MCMWGVNDRTMRPPVPPSLLSAISEVPNLSLTMYPFKTWTDEHIPQIFLLTKGWTKQRKFTENFNRSFRFLEL